MTHQTAGKANSGSSYITTADDTEIFYKDWGTGQPLVFHHGWPLSADDWDAQMMFFFGSRLSCDCTRSPRPRSFDPDHQWP